MHKFLISLDTALTGELPDQLDFLLPSMHESTIRQPLTAMPYAEALFFLRHFMALPWRSSPLTFNNGTHYTVHGLKSTLLSWSSQLQLNPELRRLQGHHQDPLRSTRLYSRDDMDGFIVVQSVSLQVGDRTHLWLEEASSHCKNQRCT